MNGGRFSLRLLAFVVGALGLLGLANSHAAADETALWNALRSGGHVAVMRHALAPGTGDPSSFTLGDCTTQRNLSDEGRAQAARIGARFRANGIETAQVFSSQWCRCLETADLLALGPVTALPMVNSFFQEMENEAAQTRALQAWLADQDLGPVPVLVTHQVNITALTGVFPSSGELVVLRPSPSGAVTVLGTIETE